MAFRPAISAAPAAICTMFTASRPQAAYCPVRAAVSSVMGHSARRAASKAMRLISSGSKARKNTSMHRERRAGGISSGLRVVAPTRRKSAGRPCLNTSCTYRGVLPSPG